MVSLAVTDCVWLVRFSADAAGWNMDDLHAVGIFGYTNNTGVDNWMSLAPGQEIEYGHVIQALIL